MINKMVWGIWFFAGTSIMISLYVLVPENKDWIDVFEALGPVIISAIVGYVAFMQYRIEEYKKRTMFYNERMAAIESLYIVLVEYMNLTNKEFIEETNKNNRKFQLFQDLYMLDLKFKILFKINQVERIRELIGEIENSLREAESYEKSNDSTYSQKVFSLKNKRIDYEEKIEKIHGSIQEQVMKTIQV